MPNNEPLSNRILTLRLVIINSIYLFFTRFLDWTYDHPFLYFIALYIVGLILHALEVVVIIKLIIGR